jgi:hypothetical protein
MHKGRRERMTTLGKYTTNTVGEYSPNNLMAILCAAYFDASGKQDGYPVLTVAGAVAPVKKWIRFEKQWRNVLLAEGVTEFHATDFAASQGEYKNWRNKTRRAAFLGKLIGIIKENTNKLFSVSVEMDAWRQVDSEFLLTEGFYSPYALAGFAVIQQTVKWATRKRVAIPEFIFEDGDYGWDGLLKLCAWDKITPVRLSKARAIPCQVGDLLAWKSRITATNSLRRLEQMERSIVSASEVAPLIRSDLASLSKLQVRPGMAYVFAHDALRRSCKLSKFPRRDGRIVLPGQ